MSRRIAHIAVSVFLLTTACLADRYRFGIVDIDIHMTRDISQDDLILSVAANNGSTTANASWALGTYEKDQDIQWSNLTLETGMSDATSNLSIAIGALNVPGASDEQTAQGIELVKGVAAIAAAAPGPQALAATAIGVALDILAKDLFNCTGPILVDNYIYTPRDLSGLSLGQKICDARTYVNEAPLTCGRASNYTVKHCLERIDVKVAATSAAWRSTPVGSMAMASVGFVLLSLWHPGGW